MAVFGFTSLLFHSQILFLFLHLRMENQPLLWYNSVRDSGREVMIVLITGIFLY